MSQTKSIGGWTAIIAARHRRDEFQRDMDYLRTLGAVVLASGKTTGTCEETVFSQTKAALSPEARRAVFGSWQSFAQMRDAAGGAA